MNLPSGVERIVDIEHDPLRHLPERAAIKIDQGTAHAQQGPPIRQVLQPRDRRLRIQIAVRRRQVMRHLEQRIMTQAGGVVAVFVTGGDHQQTETDDVGKAMDDLILSPWIVDAGGEAIGHAKAPLHFAQHEDAAIRRQETAVKTGDHRLTRDR